MLLPAWLARIVQVPADTRLTMLPETIQTLGVLLEKLTAKPDVAEAYELTSKSALP